MRATGGPDLVRRDTPFRFTRLALIVDFGGRRSLSCCIALRSRQHWLTIVARGKGSAQQRSASNRARTYLRTLRGSASHAASRDQCGRAGGEPTGRGPEGYAAHPCRLRHYGKRNCREFLEVHYCTVPLGDAKAAPLPTLSCRLSARGWPDESVHALRCKCDPLAPPPAAPDRHLRLDRMGDGELRSAAGSGFHVGVPKAG